LQKRNQRETEMNCFNLFNLRTLFRLTSVIVIMVIVLSALPPTQAQVSPPPRTTHQDHLVYLPMIQRGPEVLPYAITIANNCSDNFSTPVASPATFAYGVHQLSVGVIISGGIDLPYKMEWRINGKAQAGLTKSSTLYSSPQTIAITLIYSRFGLGCESALPAGVYESDFYLNGILTQHMKVTISPAQAMAVTSLATVDDATTFGDEKSQLHLLQIAAP
jgi:hypothetical protein